MSPYDPHSAPTTQIPVAPPAPTGQPPVAQAPEQAPAAAPQGAPISTCPNCRAPVAADQAYCLSCGARQAVARTPQIAGGAPASSGVPPQAGGAVVAEKPMRDWTPAIALGVLCALALVFAVGVLIGNNGNGNSKVAAAPPQVITVNGGSSATGTGASGTGGASPASTAATISDNWPSGKIAWTVELQTVPKAGATAATVDSTKSTATGKGATGVGVLDAANYKSIGSDYVIYSGVYPTQANAAAALAKLTKSFPGAKVIHVVPSAGVTGGSTSGGGVSGGAPVSSAQQQSSQSAIQALNNCTGTACSKLSKTNTQPLATGGTTAPKDTKPAGGGGSGSTFQ
jgi:hypothetical protein